MSCYCTVSMHTQDRSDRPTGWRSGIIRLRTGNMPWYTEHILRSPQPPPPSSPLPSSYSTLSPLPSPHHPLPHPPLILFHPPPSLSPHCPPPILPSSYSTLPPSPSPSPAHPILTSPHPLTLQPSLFFCLSKYSSSSLEMLLMSLLALS